MPRSPELMNREDTALLVVDAQEKLLETGPERRAGAVEYSTTARRSRGVERAGRRHGTVSGKARHHSVRSYWIGSVQRPTKLAFSACACGEIFERWREDGRYRVLVCGIETHVCVLQTALDLVAAGFESYLAVDAVSARHVDRP